MAENVKIWPKQGNQSKITKRIKVVADNFSGTDFAKIKSILKWINKNIKACRDQKKCLRIFARRTADKVLKDGFSTGCHDKALIFTVLCRAVGIPAKYIAGINKLSPRNKGHCVVEVYVDKTWILVDQSRNLITLKPNQSDFYRENFFIGKGLDSWDIGIKSLKDWKKRSDKIINIISKI
jgi:hypothetical protein